MKHIELKKSLRQKGYRVSYFDTAQVAANYLVDTLNETTITFGDSMTLKSMELAEKLSTNNTLVDPSHYSGSKFNEIAKSGLATEVFITSVNALAMTGELINIDSTGNRVAGSLFGHTKVFYVVGTNKIEPTMEKAIWRARNIAAPKNAKRFGFKTPCALKGDRCYDCSSSDRICNALTIHLNKMKGLVVEIILIDENLGF